MVDWKNRPTSKNIIDIRVSDDALTESIISSMTKPEQKTSAPSVWDSVKAVIPIVPTSNKFQTDMKAGDLYSFNSFEKR